MSSKQKQQTRAPAPVVKPSQKNPDASDYIEEFSDDENRHPNHKQVRRSSGRRSQVQVQDEDRDDLYDEEDDDDEGIRGDQFWSGARIVTHSNRRTSKPLARQESDSSYDFPVPQSRPYTSGSGARSGSSSATNSQQSTPQLSQHSTPQTGSSDPHQYFLRGVSAEAFLVSAEKKRKILNLPYPRQYAEVTFSNVMTKASGKCLYTLTDDSNKLGNITEILKMIHIVMFHVVFSNFSETVPRRKALDKLTMPGDFCIIAEVLIPVILKNSAYNMLRRKTEYFKRALMKNLFTLDYTSSKLIAPLFSLRWIEISHINSLRVLAFVSNTLPIVVLFNFIYDVCRPLSTSFSITNSHSESSKCATWLRQRQRGVHLPTTLRLSSRLL
jgi:hypothetical protein